MESLEVKPVGRPTVITQEVLNRLEAAFALGCTDIEACLYANISRTSLNEYMKKNPDFRTRRDELKEQPVLRARMTIVENLDNPNHAQWYLERKAKGEFSSKNETNLKLELPTPILAPTNVPTNDSNKENNEPEEKDQGSTRGDISLQDNLDPALPDPSSPERQVSETDISSVGILSALEERGDERLQEDNAGTQVLEGQQLERDGQDLHV